MSSKNRRGTSVQATQDDNGVQAHIQHVEEYSPYPSGEFLQQLHQIDPDLVNRVMTMAEQEQHYRHQFQLSQLEESKKVNNALISMDNRQLDLFSRGQWFGLVLAVGLVCLAGYGIYLGNTTVAGLAIGAIVGVLVVYVLRQRPNNTQN